MLKILLLIGSTFSRGLINKRWRPFNIVSQRQLVEIGKLDASINNTIKALIICPKSLFIMFNIVYFINIDGTINRVTFTYHIYL